ncbi:hypothetical protein BKA61DRAFT_700776 [Leptodontidium sp. MPI-SDFR-AT-0119]|nr:hypothetical protein BKA61DRAFT_700776 [Leptodontidium sp. MPI-SDFR-AT-0119]
MTRPPPKRGTANGSPQFQLPHQKSEHAFDINAGLHPASFSSTCLLPNSSNMGWNYQQNDGGPRHHAYSAQSQPTPSYSQLSLLSSMSSATSNRSRTSSAQDNPTQYSTAGAMYGARLMAPSINGYGEGPGTVEDNHWQAIGCGSSPLNGYPVASGNLKDMFPLMDILKANPMVAPSIPPVVPGLFRTSMATQSIVAGTRFLILNDGQTNSVIHAPKCYTLPTNGNLPAPRTITKGRIQKSLVLQTSSVDAIAAFGSAHRIPISRSANTNGSGNRPFPVFTKGPMVKSCHQRAKLTQGQINKLSKSKLAALKAEKLVNFHLFPKLPYELRCMIYALMIPDRRIIEVKNRKNTEENKEMGVFLLSYDFPAVFYISGEAREWAERRFNYQKSFRNNLNGQTIYYDPHRDSLLFENIHLCENFFGTSLNTGDVQGRDRAGLPKHVIDKSKAIEAPLFLAINNAWELGIPIDAFKHLGQPQNIILARPTASAGRMDRDAAKEILEGLEHVAARTRSGTSIVPPKMVCCMTYRQLRNKVEELNCPARSVVPVQEVTRIIDDVDKTATNTASTSSV